MSDVSFHSDAEAEYSDAFDWYQKRSESAATRFEAAFEAALREIVDAPARWHIVDEGHRMHLLRRFPYRIIYRVEGDEIIVIAVAHARRRADYWADRD